VKRLHGWWRAITTRAAGPRAAVTLGIVALLVFAIEALAWPVQRGRDAWDYLVYYLSFLDGSTPFPLVMLVRSPVTALVLGVPMQLGGATLLEVVAGLMYAVTAVAWAATAATFSRAAAVLTAVVYLVTTPFAVPFHEPSSDMVVATGMALFSLGLARTWRHPTTPRFAALGLGVTAMTLARPSYEVLVLAVVLPLALSAPWRVRATRAAAFAAAVVVPLGLWAVHNGIRYDDTTVSRSGALNVPFYPAYLAREVDPDAGPASRRLAALVRQQVLVLPPYRRLGVDVETYFHSGRNYEVVRLSGLVDRVDGLSSDYALLRDTAREAEVPGDLVVRGVDLTRSADTLRGWLGRLAAFEFRTKPDAWPAPAPSIDVDGKPFPNPAALPPAPDAVPYGFLACASDEIERCLLRDPGAVFRDPGLARRYREVTRTVQRWDEGLGARRPNDWLAARLDSARRLLPPTSAWLVLAIVGLAVRRPRGTLAIALLGGLALALLAVHALGGRPDPLYALPLLPALSVVAICALAAPRAAGRDEAVA
jgi:hypothetical protein